MCNDRPQCTSYHYKDKTNIFKEGSVFNEEEVKETLVFGGKE